MHTFRVVNLRRILLLSGALFALFACILSLGFGLISAEKSVAKASQPLYGTKVENEKVICLMINVYEGSEYVEKMLDIAEENQIRLTFFVGGCWAVKNPNLLLKTSILQEVGNHGYNHLDHSGMSYDANYKEIYKANSAIEKITHKKVTLFAPPSGAFCKATVDAADALGCKTVMWSKDTIDWRDHNSALITQRATSKPESGAFILMHPTAETVKALPDIIAFYKKEGYKMITVSEALSM